MFPKEKVDQLISTMSQSFQPYETADEIITKVMAHGKESRNEIINILLAYNVRCIEAYKETTKLIASGLKDTKKEN